MFLPYYIDWNKNIDFYKYVIANKNRKDVLKLCFKELIFFKKSVCYPKSFEQIDYLFLTSLVREDYVSIFSSIYKANTSKSKMWFVLSKKKCFLNLKPLLILLIYMPIFIKILFYKNKYYINIYLILKIIGDLEYYFLFRKLKFKFLTVFADMQPVENLMVQFSNKLNIPTATMQHGLYVDYLNDKKNINVVNYKNVQSRYFLAWGQDTANLINRYHDSILIQICGKPIVYPKRKLSGCDYFTVVFDHNFFIEENKKLLSLAYEVARRINIKVNIRFHPNNLRKWFFIDKNLSIENAKIENSLFVIGHTTTMLFESMHMGIPTFKFRTNCLTNFTDECLKFSTADELIEKIHKFKHFNFKQFGSYYIESSGEDSIKKYTNFYRNIEKIIN